MAWALITDLDTVFNHSVMRAHTRTLPSKIGDAEDRLSPQRRSITMWTQEKLEIDNESVSFIGNDTA